MKIGVDIIRIDRIEKSVEKFGDKFKAKYLNPSEIAIAKTSHNLAGFWATKEAISKALGCGIGKSLSFHDITISKDARGAPSFVLSNDAKTEHGFLSGSVSISHDGNFAISVVAIRTKD